MSGISRLSRFAAATASLTLVALVTLSSPLLAQQPPPRPVRPRVHQVTPPPPPAGTKPPTTESPTPVGGGEVKHEAHVENGDAEHDEHGEGAHEGHHGPEALNWADIGDKKRPAIVALVINFGVLATLYYLLGRKPVANALKQRRATIGKDIDEAQKMLDEAKERAKKYQGNLKDADVDAATAKAALVAAGTGEVERLLTEAKEKAERMRRDADRLVEQERKATQQDILGEVIELAGAEAQQLLQKSVTADDHARLAQDLLLELARRPAARAPAPKPSAPPPSNAPAAPGAQS